MINWDNLAILLYGALGTAALLLIQWLASLLALLAGTGLLLYPIMTWNSSRPRIEE